MTPTPAKVKIIPKMDTHTMHPAKHLRAYIHTNAKITAKPNPAKIHIQLFFRSLMKSPKYPVLYALAKLSATSANKLVNAALSGTHILPSKGYES